MKPLSEQEARDLLQPSGPIEPPKDLAERIKNDIPQDFGIGALAEAVLIEADETEAANTSDPAEKTSPSSWRRYRWLIAAGIVSTIGASYLTWQLRQSEAPVLATVGVEESAQMDVGKADSRASVPEETFVDSVDPAPQSPEPEPGRDAATVLVGEKEQLKQAVKEQRAQLQEKLERIVRKKVPMPASDDAEIQEMLFPAPSSPPPPAPAAPPPAPTLARPPAREAGALSVNGRRAPREGVEEQKTFRGASPRIEPADDAARKLSSLGYLADSSASAPSVQPAASTGGTAEPNDAPYGDVFYRAYGTNPFIDTEDDTLSTFALDVDTGSYTVARRYLSDGHLPPPESVRVEEFINYFDYGDEAPREDEFAIHAEGAPSRFGENERYYLLRFNLHGRQLDDKDRRPAQLTFVVDVSGSMGQENRLGLVKKALGLLLDQLRGDDRVALVVYGTNGRVLLEPTADKARIRRAIDELRPEGSTNAEEGLRLAYDLASRARLKGTINRVILCSDGVANVGQTSAESILERIRHAADQGIELTTVGFGMGNYNDVLMEQLADQGNGRYAYVDTLVAARRIFVENLTGTLQTLAADAKVQVEFDPEIVTRYRLLGYENRDVADERFRDDTVDAGEIGVGHSVTALYELKLARQPRNRDRIATLRMRYGSIERGEVVELESQVSGRDFAPRWAKASPSLRLTSLVAEFAEILKQTYWAKDGHLDEVFRLTQKVAAELEGDRDVAELANLVGKATALVEERRQR